MDCTHVVSKGGIAVMPTTSAKARHWLSTGKAVVFKLTPFTIQLTNSCGDHVVGFVVGVDGGSVEAGIAAVSGKKVVYCGDILLRRKEIVANLKQRAAFRSLRRGYHRRYHRSKYFPCRLKCLTPEKRKKEAKKETRAGLKEKARQLKVALHRLGKYNGGERPSIQTKLPPSLASNIYRQAQSVRILGKTLPIQKVIVEVGSFDPQLINNPSIAGIDYQHGETAGWDNKKAYVRWRDGYKCVYCKGKSKDPVLEVDHLNPQCTPSSSDSVDNLVTACKTCNQQRHLHPEAFKKLRPKKPYQGDMAAINAIGLKVAEEINKYYPTEITYGWITSNKRKSLGLPKEHYADAVAIATDAKTKTVNMPEHYYQHRCFPVAEYKLRMGYRSEIPISPKYIFGYRRWDKVVVNKNGITGVGFIQGRMSSGYFVISDISGKNVLFSSVHYRFLKKVESYRTFAGEQKRIMR